MGLAERRKITELQDTTFLERHAEFKKIAGSDIAYEVHQTSFADDAAGRGAGRLRQWQGARCAPARGTARVHRVRLAVADRAPARVPDGVRTDMLLCALESAEIMSGLSAALDLMETFHPPVVIDALFAGLIERDGDIAYHCAATLPVIYGKIPRGSVGRCVRCSCVSTR